VPLINHIFEGVEILKNLGSSELAQKAFCIHPIVQNGKGTNITKELESYELACEYRDKANAYLCKPETDYVTASLKDYKNRIRKLVGSMSEDCRMMLLADKLQNRKDFLIYHYTKHERSRELFWYFNAWIDYLESLPTPLEGE